MSGKGSSGFGGLIVEGAVIGLIVTLLPKLPLGGTGSHGPREEVANQRPSLAPPLLAAESPVETLPPAELNWRTAVSRPQSSATLPPPALPPADPAYVERRLDEAGEQLLSGVSGYLTRQAQEVLEVADRRGAASTQASTLVQEQELRAKNYTPKNYTAPSFHPPANAFRY